jgi:alpha-glucosidase (family GH31 glycosyl hydrolase)
VALRGQAGFSVQRVGEYDFSSPAGRDAYAQVVARMLHSGHDGWMEDFGEYTSLDAVSSVGATGSALHNRYPALYHCAVDRLTAGRPIVRFQRSGWTGAARCADDVSAWRQTRAGVLTATFTARRATVVVRG